MKTESQKEMENFIKTFNKKYPDVKVKIIEDTLENFTIDVGKITIKQRDYLIYGINKIKEKHENI